MNQKDLQIFENAEIGKIRAVSIDNIPFFIGSDLTKTLQYQNGSRDIERHVDAEDRKIISIYDGKQNRNVIAVNESGIYALILGSRMAGAKRFKRWITSEVLPSIRKNGGYIAGQENLTPEQIVANALVVAQNIINNQKEQIETMKPKAAFFDAVADSKSAISIEQVAKVLAVKGYGRNNLFRFLRERKILTEYNRPYQYYVDSGWFRVIEQHYTKNGQEVIATKTLVYQKGVDGIRKEFEKYFKEQEEKDNAEECDS